MRQKGDTTLIDLLNKIRVGDIDDKDEALLKSKFITREHDNYPHHAIHIWAENKPVNDHNSHMLSSLEESLFIINSVDVMPKNVPASMLNKVLNRSQMDTGGLAKILQVKINARVMLTSNIDVPDKLSNGQIGTVFYVKVDCFCIKKIYIKFDDETAGLKKIGTNVFAKNNKCVPIERVETKIKIRPGKISSPEIKRTQFPLMLSWAYTVHKVQGKQFKEAVICFDLFKQRSWNNGQIYVALSKVTSLEGLYLIGEYKRSAIKADIRATIEYETMRNNHAMMPVERLASLAESLTITMLNTRSLRKHAIDIASDELIIDSDIVLLTETQITAGNNLTTISEQMKDFHIVHNISSDKFCSIACCYRSTVSNVEHEQRQGLSLFKMIMNDFCQDTINILLVYRKNNSDFDSFIYTIQHFLSSSEQNIDIILGDFNINYFIDSTNCKKLSDLLTAYTQIITEPTHISGSLIDHVYVKKLVFDHFECRSIVKNIYFSDHDAIKLKLKRKCIDKS